MSRTGTAPFTTWLPVDAGADVWDLLPAASDRLRALYSSLWDAGVNPAVLVRCRARIDSVVGVGPRDADDPMGEAERAASDFAEQYSLDPHGVTDAQAAGLHLYFTPPQLAALTTAIATFDALARVRAVLASPSGTPASIAVHPTEEEA